MVIHWAFDHPGSHFSLPIRPQPSQRPPVLSNPGSPIPPISHLLIAHLLLFPNRPRSGGKTKT
ncbi:hypothetical protein BDV29DRAFT_167521 [Aspergillus leporis]|uniref:Uncharacterized protein n=1 Tax=Aspergillus leporis TaxID=41062 RepID=A0A5N5XCD5_9EURO|nr:hypothetical protein BDV29DRAFT_167521 [Aspergillus leporis]